jgi:hypothetical protein
MKTPVAELTLLARFAAFSFRRSFGPVRRDTWAFWRPCADTRTEAPHRRPRSLGAKKWRHPRGCRQSREETLAYRRGSKGIAERRSRSHASWRFPVSAPSVFIHARTVPSSGRCRHGPRIIRPRAAQPNPARQRNSTGESAAASAPFRLTTRRHLSRRCECERLARAD